jgi:hypothetical protein
MLYTISEVSDLINLSKVSIYKKLKLKELQGHIVKKQGVTYVDDIGFNLIKSSLKLNDEVKTGLNNDDNKNDLKQEIATDKTDLISYLKEQLIVKDNQIAELMQRLAAEQELVKNMQVLQLNNPQKQNLVEAPENESEKTGFWGRLFKNK